MFLKKLYRFNKTAFFSLLLFLIAFIYLNYKWGVHATPVYQYGMFSSTFYMKDTQTVFKIYTNGQLLDVTKYSFIEADRLFVSLQNYAKQKNANESIYNVMKQVPAKIGFAGMMKHEVYSNDLTDEAFTKWYRQLLEKITNKPVTKFEVYQQKALWHNNALKEIASPEKISFIVTN